MNEPEVIILTTSDSQRNSPFLANFGVTSANPALWALCRMPTQHELDTMDKKIKTFRYEIFSLLVRDEKLINLTNEKNGIVILIDISENVSSIFEYSKSTILNNPAKPILILIENSKDQYVQKMIDFIYMIKKYVNVSHRAVFGVDYTNKQIIDACKTNLKPEKWFDSVFNEITYHQKTFNTSSNISDMDMMSMFSSCTLDLKFWDHYGRLRIVYLSLTKHGYDDTINTNGWLCSNWKIYKTSIGHGHLWNYSLTRLWTEILSPLINKYDTFDILFKSNPHLHKGRLFQEYYSNDIIFSSKAKNEWVKPNLKQLYEKPPCLHK